MAIQVQLLLQMLSSFFQYQDHQHRPTEQNIGGELRLGFTHSPPPPPPVKRKTGAARTLAAPAP